MEGLCYRISKGQFRNSKLFSIREGPPLLFSAITLSIEGYHRENSLTYFFGQFSTYIYDYHHVPLFAPAIYRLRCL